MALSHPAILKTFDFGSEARGLIHRDVTPDNIWDCSRGASCR
jgi:hypothetical protein